MGFFLISHYYCQYKQRKEILEISVNQSYILIVYTIHKKIFTGKNILVHVSDKLYSNVL